MARSYDAIVIGAGVIGASIAFHLAQLGLRRTLVVDRGAICSGNTRKSGALVRMHYTNRAETALAVASLPYFQNWAQLVGGDAGFRPVGFLLLLDPANRAKLERNLTMQRALGVRTRLVEGGELRDIQPSIEIGDGAIGAFEPDSGYADPVATTHSLMNAARDRGVTIREGLAVEGIRQRGGRVLGVTTSEGDVDAPTVICAANIWSPALLRSVGIDLELWPLRAQMGFYQRPSQLRQQARVVLDLVQLNYARPEGDDQYLMGGPWSDRRVADLDGYDEGNDAGFAERQRARLSRRLPPVSQAAYLRGQAGLYDMSPDTRAILDRAPGLEGLFLAAGFSGSGFKIAPIVGACLAELAAEGQARSADIRPFRFSRFAENDPIRSPDEYALTGDWGMKW